MQSIIHKFNFDIWNDFFVYFKHVEMLEPIQVEEGDMLGFTYDGAKCPIALVSDIFHPGAKTASLQIEDKFPLTGHVYHFTDNFVDKKFLLTAEVELKSQ